MFVRAGFFLSEKITSDIVFCACLVFVYVVFTNSCPAHKSLAMMRPQECMAFFLQHIAQSGDEGAKLQLYRVVQGAGRVERYNPIRNSHAANSD